MKQLIIFLFANFSLFAQQQIQSIQLNVISEDDKVRIVDSINKYRRNSGLNDVVYLHELDTLAKLRTNTIFGHIDTLTEEVISANPIKQLHFGADNDINRFIVENLPEDTSFSYVSECSARLTYSMKSKDLISTLFKGWKLSPEHWKSIMDPEFKYVSLYWKKGDKFLIASLIFFDEKIKINPEVKKKLSY
jgi:hypothetical protein